MPLQNSASESSNEARRSSSSYHSSRLAQGPQNSRLPMTSESPNEARRSSSSFHSSRSAQGSQNSRLPTMSETSNEARRSSSSFHPSRSAQGSQNPFPPTTSQVPLSTETSSPEEMPGQVNDDLYSRLSSSQRLYFESSRVPFGINMDDPLSNFVYVDISDTEVYALYCLSKTNPNRPFYFPKKKWEGGAPEFLSMRETRETQWYYEYQPYLGFVPRDDVFDGPVFGCLKGTRTFFETKVVGHGGMYIFDPTLAESWLRLESALLYIICEFHVLLRPLSAPPIPTPSDCKFFCPKKTIKNVVDSVLFAQKQFLGLMAQLSYCATFSHHIPPLEGFKGYRLISRLANLDAIWMRDLGASKAIQTTNRTGYIVAPNDIQKPLAIHTFNAVGVPVYIPFATIVRKGVAQEAYEVFPAISQEQLNRFALPFYVHEVVDHINNEWGSIHQNHFDIPFQQTSQPVLPLLFPNLDQGMEPPETFQAPWTPNYLPTPSYPPHENDDLPSPMSPEPVHEDLDDDNLPDPLPDSNQPRGFWLFHQYKSIKANLAFEEETEDDQEEYDGLIARKEEGRVMNQSNTLPTSIIGSFYVWEPTLSHSEFLLRRRLQDEELRRIWPTLPSTHRVHNPIIDEWDLFHISCNFVTFCRMHTDPDEPNPEDIDLLPSSNTDVGTQERGGQDSVNSDRSKVLSEKLQGVLSQRLALFCENDPVENARRQYGFLFPNPPLVRNASKSKDVAWWYLLDHVNCTVLPLLNSQICETLWLLREGRHQELTSLLDILADPGPIIARNTVHIKRYPSAQFKHTVLRERNLYILEFPGERSPDWYIGTSQASDLVFALREGWANRRSTLIEKFLENGIRFYTLALVVAPQYQQQTILEARFDVPLEPVHHEYTMTDFYEYEKRREDLFDSPYGRVAGRSGGIVARLWRRDVKKFRHRVEEVNIGPTEVALWRGIRVQCGDKEYYDDELSSVMDGYICGQYRARQIHTADIDDWHKNSWYPTNHAFNFVDKSSASRWTDRNENALLKVEKDIHTNFTTHPATYWKNFSNKKQGLLDGWYEDKCCLFLDQYISQKEHDQQQQQQQSQRRRKRPRQF